MLRSHLRDELALLLRTEMMTLDEIGQAIATAHAATFIADLPPLDDRSTSDRSVTDDHAPIALEIEV
jgi:hypothetical protein